MAGIPERVGILETDMKTVKEGVANFRDFQKDAREFFTESRSRAAAEMEFHNKRDQEIKDSWNLRTNIVIAVGTLASVLLAILIWLHGQDAIKKGVLTLPNIGQMYTARNSQDAGSSEVPNH